MEALVADADLVGAVAGLRGLAAAGRDALVLGARRTDAAMLSRHAAGRAVGPDPGEDPAGFAARVGELARAHGPLVVYPTREETIDALLREPLPSEALLPFPAGGAVDALRDKRRLVELAAGGGLRAPATLAEGAAAELLAAPPDAPALVKPTRRGPGVPEVAVALTAEQLRERLEAFPPGEPVLLQEPVSGNLLCVAVVVDRDGRLVERFQQTVERVWPWGAGAATVARSAPPDEELCAGAAAMLAAAGYWGLAQLDFMTAAAGPRLIDVNPRFYISLALALASGVNLPGAWHAVARGEPAGAPSSYRTGLSYRRLESDVSAAAHGQPRLLFERPPRPVVGSVWTAGDPLPALALAARRIGAFAGGRVRARRPPEPDAVTVVPVDERLAAEWRALEDPAAAPPYLCWDWLAAWRAVYEPPGLAALRVGAPDRPPVALGLVERRALGRWRFAGAPVTPVRTVLVREADAERAWRALAAAGLPWRALDVAGARAPAGVLPGAALERTPTWTVPLPATFEDYLAACSRSSRKGHRQKLRRLAQEAGEIAPVAAEDALEDFVRLHNLRAAAKGEHHPQMDARLVALLLALRGSEAIGLRLLALRAGGRLAGVTVRLDRPRQRASWFYNAGIDPAFDRLGPGVLLELGSIRDAIEHGHESFDLGLGYWRYKQDLGGREQPLWSGRAFAPGPAGAVLRGAAAASAGARRRAPTGVRNAYRRARRLSAGRTRARQA